MFRSGGAGLATARKELDRKDPSIKYPNIKYPNIQIYKYPLSKYQISNIKYPNIKYPRPTLLHVFTPFYTLFTPLLHLNTHVYIRSLIPESPKSRIFLYKLYQRDPN